MPLSAIPLALRQATIAIEDTSFYQNPGLDIRGIARAAWADLRSGDLVAGGSTIATARARLSARPRACAPAHAGAQAARGRARA
ncbi:MAG: transglycosylase domain-containing protein [Kouleothrix sp.]